MLILILLLLTTNQIKIKTLENKNLFLKNNKIILSKKNYSNFLFEQNKFNFYFLLVNNQFVDKNMEVSKERNFSFEIEVIENEEFLFVLKSDGECLRDVCGELKFVPYVHNESYNRDRRDRIDYNGDNYNRNDNRDRKGYSCNESCNRDNYNGNDNRYRDGDFKNNKNKKNYKDPLNEYLKLKSSSCTIFTISNCCDDFNLIKMFDRTILDRPFRDNLMNLKRSVEMVNDKGIVGLEDDK